MRPGHLSIGTHCEALEVNRPKCPVAHYNRDGTMPFGIKTNPDAYDEPNSFSGPVEDKSFEEPPHRYAGDVGRSVYDHFSQPRALFNLMDDGQRGRLCQSIADAMQGVPEFIIERQLALFDKVDPAYGRGVRAALAKTSPRAAETSISTSHAVAAE